MEIAEALAFDDVLLVPQASAVLPSNADIASSFCRGISVSVPIVSSAMDTVTESEMAIELARIGGIGVIHRNQTTERQASQVARVKRFESIVITNPYTLKETNTVSEAKALIASKGVSGIPIVDDDNKLRGILTRKDLLLENRGDALVSLIMGREVITAKKGVTTQEALSILKSHKVEKLPIVDDGGTLVGLMTLKDIVNREENPGATADELGRLRVAAAIGVFGNWLDRASTLIEAKADALVIDTAHSHSAMVLDAVKTFKERFPDTPLVVGNIGTREAASDLVALGVDGVKVGIGPGSICTTRVVAGVGVPQFTAICEVSSVTRGAGVPLIADGGIRYSGDAVKALAGGANSVMLGNLLAGTPESPGEEMTLEGRKYKYYRGMGSLGAMVDGTSDRYFHTEATKFIPEGVEGIVPMKGSVREVMYQLVGGIRSGMGYVGAGALAELREKARFVKVTRAGASEGHPHDVIITREAPNYAPPQS